MLPHCLFCPIWILIALIWPACQSLHVLQNLQTGNLKEAKIWLFYWFSYMAGSWLLYFFGWLLRIPFYVLPDVHDELTLAFMLYLVFPRTMGIERLRDSLPSSGNAVVSKMMIWVLMKVQSSFPAPAPGTRSVAAPREPAVDEPGKYTIIKVAGVTQSLETFKAHAIAQLNVGDVIDVLEIVHNEARIRARIANPEGWLSIFNSETGTRWAVRGDQIDLGAMRPPEMHSVLANAAAAGCDPTALFQRRDPNSAVPQEVSAEDAWEAMAILESRLESANDPSESASVRQAAAMLKTMLGALCSGDTQMLGMAQMMMPDLAKIWANDDTREYLQGLLAGNAAAAASVPANTSAASCSSGSSSGTTGAPSQSSGSGSSSGIEAPSQSSGSGSSSSFPSHSAGAASSSAASGGSSSSVHESKPTEGGDSSTAS